MKALTADLGHVRARTIEKFSFVADDERRARRILDSLGQPCLCGFVEVIRRFIKKQQTFLARTRGGQQQTRERDAHLVVVIARQRDQGACEPARVHDEWPLEEKKGAGVRATAVALARLGSAHSIPTLGQEIFAVPHDPRTFGGVDQHRYRRQHLQVCAQSADVHKSIIL